MQDFKRTKHNPTIGMTNEEVTQYWINKSIEKFKDNFDYTEVGIITIKKDPCIIICKNHGSFNTSFERHLDANTGCPKCGEESCRNNKRMTFEEFTRRLNEVNPNRNFKILSTEFKGRQIKKEKLYTQDEFGICKISVSTLLQGVDPSIKTAIFPKLYNINRYKKLNKFNHLNFENSEYNGALKYTTVKCRKHGNYPTKPNWILNKYGCPKCADEATGNRLRSNTEDFKNKGDLVHGEGFYDYSMSIYTSAIEKLEIGCKVYGHGTFWQKPNGHLSGEGCPICGVENGGYGKQDYINQSKGRESTLYIIRCFNESEEFYKIGITFVGLKSRFNNKNKLPYSYETIYEYKCDAGCVWDLEKEHHKQYKSNKYLPETLFQGYTECFNTSLPIDEIINNLKIN